MRFDLAVCAVLSERVFAVDFPDNREFTGNYVYFLRYRQFFAVISVAISARCRRIPCSIGTGIYSGRIRESNSCNREFPANNREADLCIQRSDESSLIVNQRGVRAPIGALTH